MDYRIWGHEPLGYHLTNLLLHLISVVGVYFLCKNLGLDRETSAVSSLIFSILPIQPEAVVWIASRFDLTATCLIIWTAVLYLKFRRTGRRWLYILALLLSFIAMLSKENAFMAPLLLLSLEYFASPKRDIRPAILPLLGFTLLVAATFGYRWIALGGIGGYADRDGDSAMLSGIDGAAQRKALKLALISLLGLALSHNVAAWRRVGDISYELLAELKRLVPDPPPHAVFVFRHKPDYIEGIFYHGTLYQAVNLTYNRTDLWAARDEDAPPQSGPAAADPAGRTRITVKWLGKPNGLIELVKD